MLIKHCSKRADLNQCITWSEQGSSVNLKSTFREDCFCFSILLLNRKKWLFFLSNMRSWHLVLSSTQVAMYVYEKWSLVFLFVADLKVLFNCLKQHISFKCLASENLFLSLPKQHCFALFSIEA